MRTLPTEMIRVLAPFAPLFSGRVFKHVEVLIAGAILTPGKTHRQFGLASNGSGSAEDLPSLPSSVEPGEVVHHGGESYPARFAGGSLRA